MQRLQTLDLSHNLIKDNAAAHLANSNLPALLNLIVCRCVVNSANNQMSFKGVREFSNAQWPSLAFLQAKDNSFEPTKEMEKLEFRTDMKMFRLELQ